MSQDGQLRGDLGEMPVSTLLHWMGWSRKSGLLELHGPAEQLCAMRFVQGRLTECSRFAGAPPRVELDRSRTPEDLGRLMREALLWTEGRFVLHPAEAAEPEPAPQPEGEPGPARQSLEALVADSLLQGRYRLPALSEAAAKISRMRRDPRTSLKQISDIISTDPALTQALLRFVNSAAEGPIHPVDSLPMAVARVGFRKIRPLALAVCLYSAELRSPQLRQLQQPLWRHSVAVALLARHLAVKLKGDEDEAFLCGLLHDLGKAVLLGLIDDLTTQAKAPSLATGRLEELLAQQHTKVGRRLHLSWSLPESLDAVAAFHHAPEQAVESGKLVAIVAMANTWMNFLEKHGTLPEGAELERTAAAGILGLGLRQFENLSPAALEFFEQGQNF